MNEAHRQKAPAKENEQGVQAKDSSRESAEEQASNFQHAT
jgi:hypothetical protein